MLEVMDVSVRIGGVQILSGVSLRVERGQISCLLGRNGAGKTTTIKTIMGLVKPESGKIVLDGVDITARSVHERARLGVSYAPEDLRIFPWLTAEENVLLAARLAGRDEKEALEVALNVFPELRSFLGRQGYYLSGGEKRMVAIARALAQRPKYILLDELLEGLAPIVVERLGRALRDIAASGVGVLMAESNAMLAKRVTSEVYVIERGEIIFSGNIDSALESEPVAKVLGTKG